MKAKIINNLPNMCTMANALCGIFALILALFYKTVVVINISCVLITIGGCFDAMDGRLARRLKLSSEIGKQLDSFADLITFGITPMCVFLTMHSLNNENYLSLMEIFITGFYILCAMYRLARYNVSDYTNYFEGLPTTASGVLISMYIFISNLTFDAWTGNLLYTCTSYSLIIFLGCAMISKFRVNRI